MTRSNNMTVYLNLLICLWLLCSAALVTSVGSDEANGDSGNVFENFYFAGLNPLDRETVEDANTPDLPVEVADIQDMLKAYKNIDENKIVHNLQRRDLKYEYIDPNDVAHLKKLRHRRDVPAMQAVFDVRDESAYEDEDDKKKMQRMADNAPAEVKEIKSQIIDLVMQELVKEMYPDNNREELRQHVYKVIRRLPTEAMYETAVKWGIIDKNGNKVISKANRGGTPNRRGTPNRHRRSADYEYSYDGFDENDVNLRADDHMNKPASLEVEPQDDGTEKENENYKTMVDNPDIVMDENFKKPGGFQDTLSEHLMDIGNLEEAEYQGNNEDIIPENVIKVGYDNDYNKKVKDDLSAVENNGDFNEAPHSEDVKSDVTTRLPDDAKVNMNTQSEGTPNDVQYKSKDREFEDLESGSQDSEADRIIKDIEDIVHNDEEDIPKEAKNSAYMVSDGKIRNRKITDDGKDEKYGNEKEDEPIDSDIISSKNMDESDNYESFLYDMKLTFDGLEHELNDIISGYHKFTDIQKNTETENIDTNIKGILRKYENSLLSEKDEIVPNMVSKQGPFGERKEDEIRYDDETDQKIEANTRRYKTAINKLKHHKNLKGTYPKQRRKHHQRAENVEFRNRYLAEKLGNVTFLREKIEQIKKAMLLNPELANHLHFQLTRYKSFLSEIEKNTPYVNDRSADEFIRKYAHVHDMRRRSTNDNAYEMSDTLGISKDDHGWITPEEKIKIKRYLEERLKILYRKVKEHSVGTSDIEKKMRHIADGYLRKLSSLQVLLPDEMHRRHKRSLELEMKNKKHAIHSLERRIKVLKEKLHHKPGDEKQLEYQIQQTQHLLRNLLQNYHIGKMEKGRHHEHFKRSDHSNHQQDKETNKHDTKPVKNGHKFKEHNNRHHNSHGFRKEGAIIEPYKSKRPFPSYHAKSKRKDIKTVLQNEKKEADSGINKSPESNSRLINYFQEQIKKLKESNRKINGEVGRLKYLEKRLEKKLREAEPTERISHSTEIPQYVQENNVDIADLRKTDNLDHDKNLDIASARQESSLSSDSLEGDGISILLEKLRDEEETSYEKRLQSTTIANSKITSPTKVPYRKTLATPVSVVRNLVEKKTNSFMSNKPMIPQKEEEDTGSFTKEEIIEESYNQNPGLPDNPKYFDYEYDNYMDQFDDGAPEKFYDNTIEKNGDQAIYDNETKEPGSTKQEVDDASTANHIDNFEEHDQSQYKDIKTDVTYFEKISDWARSLHNNEAHKDKTDASGEDGIHETITRDDGKVVDRIQYDDSYYNSNGVDMLGPNPEFSNLQFSDNDDEEEDSTDLAETTLKSVNHSAQTSSDQLVIKNAKGPKGDDDEHPEGTVKLGEGRYWFDTKDMPLNIDSEDLDPY